MSAEGAALTCGAGPSGLIGSPVPPRAGARGYSLPALRALKRHFDEHSFPTFYINCRRGAENRRLHFQRLRDFVPRPFLCCSS
jgi:hypothetical protein